MEFFLRPELQQFFPDKARCFDSIMQLQGEVYRELEGRSTQRIKLGNQYYFIKKHTGIGWKEVVKNLLQLRLPVLSAKNEWLAIQYLQKNNLLTMTLVGYGKQGFNPATLQSFLLTEELQNVISLEDLVKTWQVKKPNITQKRALIAEIARVAHVMHASGMNHRDFYLCHFMFDKLAAEHGKIRLFLIDLHRAQLRSQVPLRWRIKDLAGLYYSAQGIGLTTRDMLFFIKKYRQQSLRSILQQEQTFWQKVKNRGDRMYRKHGK